jgi:lysophospholipase L1-like esterase
MRRGLWISLVLCGLWASGCKKAETPTSPTPPTPPAGAPIFYTAIAASDGIGFMSSVPCDIFDPNCPSGTGYVYLLKRRFQAAGRTVTLANLSVPGSVLSPAIQALARDIGRTIIGTFLDQANVVLPTTTHVTIFAGGNDANVIAQNVRAGRGAGDIRGFVDEQVRIWGTDLDELIRRIRARAPTVRIVALNLPNFGAAPYVAGNTIQERSIVQRIAVGLSDRINALTSQNVIVVDLMCEGRIYEASSYSSDGFHPSDRGHALMAEVVYPALANGTASSPSTTCAQRTLLPAF